MAAENESGPAVISTQGMSIERKLPLLLTGVLLVVLLAGILVLNREVGRAAAVVAADKVKQTTATIASTGAA